MRTDDGWCTTTYAAVCAVLESPALGVPEAPASSDVGTIAWLRASVSRFSNGPDHAQRRATVVQLLRTIDPRRLRAEAHRRALTNRNHRQVVAASLAVELGAADPDAVADAVVDCAAAYFPGADEAAIRRADVATKRLVALLTEPDDDLDVVVARIAILVQACDATAQLIDATLQHSDIPPVRVMRRIAQRETTIEGTPIAPGDTISCDIVLAAREAPELTFGHGPRACPGIDQALALVAAVTDGSRTPRPASLQRD
jgi:cytochrome P450